MSIISELKDAGKILQEAGKIEQYQQILDAQQKMLDMQDEIADLKEENKRLKDISEVEKDLDFRDNCYYKKSDNSGPYCSACWDYKNRLIHLHKNPISGKIYCPVCEKIIKHAKVQTYIPKRNINPYSAI